jgi:hypothetical protein
MIDTLTSVILNMPHKSALYAALMGMVAEKNPQLIQEMVERVVGMGVNQVMLTEQDGFQSKLLFRFLGFLVDLHILSPPTLLQWLSQLINLHSHPFL